MEFPTVNPHDVSGNIGAGDPWSVKDEAVAYYDQLLNNAKNDPLWLDGQNEDTKILAKGRCMHCKNWVGHDHVIQIQHVLNGCKSFKTQERYLWRHLAVLDYLGTLLEKNIEQDGKHWAAFRCYLDVPSRRTHDDGTVPDQLLQTELKPDIFILDQRDHLERPEVIILDLTIPWDDRIDAARSEKLAKYSKLVAAIKSQEAFNVTYQSIEIGSYGQRLSDGSESALRLLYNYISPKINFDAFRSHVVHLVNNCSYEIFSSRNESKWDSRIYPIPPMQSEMVFNITEMVEQLSNSPARENDLPQGSQLSNSYEEEQEEKVVKEIFQSEKDETDHSIQQQYTHSEETTEKFEVSKHSIAISPAGVKQKFAHKPPPLQKPSSNVKPEIPAKPTKKTSLPSQIKMSWFELIAILLIFCLILVALNVMWTNFYKTMFICCLSFPILRWMGRI